jgi:hypothetical protein
MPEGPAQEPLVQGRYTWEFADGTVYSDSIVLPRSQFNALTPTQLRDLKRDRAQAWKATVDASRTRVPTVDEQRAERREQRQALRDQRDTVLAQLAQVDADIAAET